MGGKKEINDKKKLCAVSPILSIPLPVIFPLSFCNFAYVYQYIVELAGHHYGNRLCVRHKASSLFCVVNVVLFFCAINVIHVPECRVRIEKASSLDFPPWIFPVPDGFNLIPNLINEVYKNCIWNATLLQSFKRHNNSTCLWHQKCLSYMYIYPYDEGRHSRHVCRAGRLSNITLLCVACVCDRFFFPSPLSPLQSCFVMSWLLFYRAGKKEGKHTDMDV